jgi:hypothetical protein
MEVVVFRSVILYHAEIRERIRQLLIDSIIMERKGIMIDKSLIKSVLSMVSSHT